MVGEIRLIAGATSGGLPPSQWLLLNGDVFTNAAYPDLRNVIGTAFGGSGSDFAVPDLRGSAGAGAGEAIGTIPFAGRVGSPNLSISIAQMAAHTHSFFPFTTLTVTKTADTNDGVCDAVDCSLREALTVAAGDGILGNIIFNIPASSAGCGGTDCTERGAAAELCCHEMSSLVGLHCDGQMLGIFVSIMKGLSQTPTALPYFCNICST